MQLLSVLYPLTSVISITQYACNKPTSWPLNIRLSAAKTRFTQSKFIMLHVLHCVVIVTFAREKKEREPLFKQTLKVKFHIITSLWVVFGPSTLISKWRWLSRVQYLVLGTLSNYDDNGSENFAKKWICVLSNLIKSIWTRSICQMQATFPGVEFARILFKFKKRKENSSSYVHVLHKTSN